MNKKEIQFFGAKVILVCDGKCNKAWGINSRPQVQLDKENEDDYYYFKEGRLLKKHEPGSVCLIAPGEVVWKSDSDALHLLLQGLPAPLSVGAVAAKYLINYVLEI